MNSKSVLFVCLGNICRSPMAEGIFRAKLMAAGLSDSVHVDSCGTAGWHAGKAPHQGSIDESAANGIDITRQTSRQLTVADGTDFDWLIVMDASNERDVLSRCPGANVARMLSFSSDTRLTDVPDPYYEGGFPGVFELIDKACDGLLEHVSDRL